MMRSMLSSRVLPAPMTVSMPPGRPRPPGSDHEVPERVTGQPTDHHGPQSDRPLLRRTQPQTQRRARSPPAYSSQNDQFRSQAHGGSAFRTRRFHESAGCAPIGSTGSPLRFLTQRCGGTAVESTPVGAPEHRPPSSPHTRPPSAGTRNARLAAGSASAPRRPTATSPRLSNSSPALAPPAPTRGGPPRGRRIRSWTARSCRSTASQRAGCSAPTSTRSTGRTGGPRGPFGRLLWALTGPVRRRPGLPRGPRTRHPRGAPEAGRLTSSQRG
jgi:hypothetical protein